MRTDQKQYGGIWRRFFRMLKEAGIPYLLLGISLVTSFASAIIGLKTPDITASLVNSVTEEVLLQLFWLGLATLVLGFTTTAVKYFAKAVINRNMQLLAVDKILYLRQEEIEKQDPRQMVTRVTTDTTLMSDLLITVAVDEVPRLYFMIGALIKVFSNYSTKLGWVMLVSIPVVFIGSFIAGRLTFGRSDAAQAAISHLTARLGEKINNMPIIKSYNNQAYEEESGLEVIHELEVMLKKKALITRLGAGMTSLATMIPTVCVIAAGAALVLSGEVETTSFVAYYALAGSFIGYVAAHMTLWIQVKDAQGATNRLANILEQPDEIITETRGGALGDIEFKNVTKRFGGHVVLDGVSFTIEQGKKTAFVGYSGSGKSTALNLLEQFYYPEEGQILMGGHPAGDWDIRSWRDQFTYVPQNAPGFSGSIRDLVNYGSDHPADDEAIWNALEQTEAKAFVTLLGGLDYDIGNNGGKLSGGQKQKLCMARALLDSRDIMLLDEATSALDVRSTERIQKVLDEKMKGKTMILVAHNISTVANADHIIVFNQGKIEAEGTHGELLERCRLYRELAQGQKGGNL